MQKQTFKKYKNPLDLGNGAIAEVYVLTEITAKDVDTGNVIVVERKEQPVAGVKPQQILEQLQKSRIEMLEKHTKELAIIDEQIQQIKDIQKEG